MSVSTTVLAPIAGTVVGLDDIPDPVFAGGLVGPGVAIDPPREPVTVLAPIDGEIVKLHPHAFVIVSPDGRGVLVHLGIDTVQLRGEGFTLLVTEGERVTAGRPVVTWDPARVQAGGRSPICPVIALDAAPESVTRLAFGDVRAGDELFVWK